MQKATENIEEQIKFIDEINRKVWNLRGTPPKEFDAMGFTAQVLEKATEINYLFGKGQALLNLGMGTFIISNDPALALERMNEALKIFKELDNKEWASNSLMTLGLITNTIGKPEVGLSNALRGIVFFENGGGEIHDRVMSYYILGTIYKDLKKYDESEKYYKVGVSDPDLVITTWSGRIYLGLATIYSERKNYDDAIKMNLKGLEILRLEKNGIGESRALNDLGIIYKSKKDYSKALAYFLEALEIREHHHITRFALTSYIDIADLYNDMGNQDEALNYLKKGETVAISINFPAKLAHIYRELGNIYKLKKEYQQALLYYEKLMALTLELNQKESEGKINSLTQELVKEKDAEIERIKNVELKEAYDLIEFKNKEILDSINYAKRIQYVLLANTDLLNDNLPEHYILFKPKDIVSGDFYWATKKDDYFYIAVCDSTGHGVPGAFMSLLNISFLNEAINEKNILEPNEILNHVRRKLISHINGGRDGMDAVLLRINKNTKIVTYAGANNTPIVIRNKAIVELPYDKMPVGKGEKEISFTNYTFDLKKGDTLHLCTDGMPDQFGGPKGKKFMHKRLKEFLISICDLSMNEQQKKIDQIFTNWKGDLEQVDDITILGMRF